LEARLLSALDEVLTAEGPANVDRESVTVTGEGATVTIALIPHRDLGGYSLTVSLLPARFLLGWAPVFDLESHDDLDLAEVVTDWQAAGWPGDDRVAAAIRAELQRPIRVRITRDRIFRRFRMRCAVEVGGKWNERSVCRISSGLNREVDVGYTTLTGPERPAVRCPAPIERWRRRGEPAWPLTPHP